MVTGAKCITVLISVSKVKVNNIAAVCRTGVRV